MPGDVSPRTDSAAASNSLDDYRSYLTLLARAGLGGHFQAKIGASDVVQQTLLEAHRAAAQFRGTSTAARAAWLRQILARNIASVARDLGRAKRDFRRERSLERLMEESTSNFAAVLADPQPSPSQRASREETTVEIARALDALPANQREAVVLRHFEGRSLEEIAGQLDCSTAAVAGLIYRGLKALRGKIQRQHQS